MFCKTKSHAESKLFVLALNAKHMRCSVQHFILPVHYTFLFDVDSNISLYIVTKTVFGKTSRMSTRFFASQISFYIPLDLKHIKNGCQTSNRPKQKAIFITCKHYRQAIDVRFQSYPSKHSMWFKIVVRESKHINTF